MHIYKNNFDNIRQTTEYAAICFDRIILQHFSCHWFSIRRPIKNEKRIILEQLHCIPQTMA